MKARDAHQRPQPFANLNLPPIQIENFLAVRLNRIGVLRDQTTQALHEMREVIFLVRGEEVEAHTKETCRRLMKIVAQLGVNQSSADVIHLRTEMLELLWVLNFHLTPDGGFTESVTALFKLIESGSLSDMSAAVRIIRQAFELAEPVSNAMIVTIGNLTLKAADSRLRWLMINEDKIEDDWYFPFMTLLTVLLFCGRSYEHIHESICECLLGAKQFLLAHHKDTKRHFGKYLPAVVIKSRIVHSAMLSVDSAARDAKMDFLPEAYIELNKCTPASYQSVIDEFTSSFFYYLSQKVDEKKLVRVRTMLPYFMDFLPENMSSYYSSFMVVARIYEVAVMAFPLTQEMTEALWYFTAQLLDMPDAPATAKITKFHKLVGDLLRRTPLESDRDALRYAELMGVVRHGIEGIIEEADGHPIDHRLHATDMEDVQEIIAGVALVFDSFVKILAVLDRCVKTIFKAQAKVEPASAHTRAADAQRVAIRPLPIDAFMYSIVIDTYAVALIALVRLRHLWHRCSLNFSKDLTTNDFEAAMRSCKNNLAYMRMFERVKHFNMIVHQLIKEVITSCQSTLVISMVWRRFIKRMIERKGYKTFDSSLMRTLFTSMILFSSFFEAAINIVVENVHNGLPAADIITFVTLVLKSVMEAPPSRTGERPVTHKDQFGRAFVALLDIISTMYRRLPEIHKLVLLVVETARYIEVYTETTDFCKGVFTRDFVVKMTSFLRTMPDTTGVLIEFLSLCNRYALASVEHSVVVSFLVEHLDRETQRVLVLLDAIRQRQPALVSGEAIGRRVGPVALSVIRRNSAQTIEAVKNLAGIFLPEYGSPFTELTQTHDVIMVKNGHKFQVSVHHLLVTVSQAAIGAPVNASIWDTLHDIVMDIVEPKSDSCIQPVASFVDLLKTLGCAFLSIVSRSDPNRAGVSRFFSRLVQILRHNMKVMAVIICSIIGYKFIFPDSVFDLSMIATQEQFTEFFDECVRQIECDSPCFSMNRFLVCDVVLSQCGLDVVNLPCVCCFVIRAMGYVQIGRESPDWVSAAMFKFDELAIIPSMVKKLIIRVKELIRQSEMNGEWLLDTLACQSSRNVRLVCAELLSAANVPNDMFHKFMQELQLPSESVEEKLLLLDMHSTIMRLAPYLIDDYISCSATILESLELEKVLGVGHSIVSTSIELVLSSSKGGKVNKSETMIHYILRGVNLSPVVAGVLQRLLNSLDKEKQRMIWSFVTGKVKDDGLIELGKEQHTNLANWRKIVLYWKVVFILSPETFVAAIISQIRGVLSGSIHTATAQQVHEAFGIWCTLLSLDEIRSVVVTSNLFEEVAALLLTMCKKSVVVVSEMEIMRIGKFFKRMGDSGIEYLRMRFASPEWVSVVAWLLGHASNESLLNKFVKDRDAITCLLMFDEPPSPVQYHAAILVARTSQVLLQWKSLLSITSYIFRKKSDQFYMLPLMESLEANYDTVGLCTADIIMQMLEHFDHRNYGYVERLISVFVSDTRVTMESLCGYLRDKPEGMCDLIVRFVIGAFLKKREMADEDLGLIGVNAHRRVLALEFCADKLPNFVVSSSDIVALLDEIDDHHDRDRIFVLWIKCGETDGFDVIFSRFMSTLSVHVSNEQKKVCDALSIPGTANADSLAIIIERHIEKFIRHVPVLVCLWRIIANNAETLTQPLARFWKVLVNQISGIRLYARKNQVLTVIPLCEIITGLFCRFPLVPTASHYVVRYYSDFMLTTVKNHTDLTGSQVKKYLSFVECCCKLAEKYGAQLRVIPVYCRMFVEYGGKLLPYMPRPSPQQQNPQPGVQQNQQQNAQQRPPPAANQVLSHFVHEVLFPVLGRMVCVALKFETPYISEQLVDVLIGSANINCPSWPSAVYALSLIAQAGIHMDKIRNLLDLLDRDVIGLAMFPIFWGMDAFTDIRGSKLLAAATKFLSRDQIDSHLVVFLMNVVLRTVIEAPHGQALQRLFSELRSVNKKLRSVLLPTLVMAPAKLRVVSNFTDAQLDDPYICRTFARVMLTPDSTNSRLTSLSKIAFCLERNSEICLNELAKIEIRQLADIAKGIWGMSVPWSIILQYFMPGDLTIMDIFVGAKFMHNDFLVNVISDFFLYSASPYVPTDTTLQDAYSFNKRALRRWEHMDDSFSELSEVQVLDLCDGRKCLEGAGVSRISMFLHHGMIPQAMSSYRDAPNDISSEDMSKLQMRDEVVAELEFGTTLADDDEAVERAIHALPPVARCPFSDSLANYVLVNKRRSLHRTQNGSRVSVLAEPLSHFFNPRVHEAFAKLRRNGCPPEAIASGIHAKQHRRSVHQHFSEPRPVLPAGSELLEQENAPWKHLLYCFSSHFRDADWVPALKKITVSGLMKSPNKDVFLAALYALTKHKGAVVISECISRVPDHWIMPFSEKGADKLCPRSFSPSMFSVCHDFSMFLNNLTEIDIAELGDGEVVRSIVTFPTACEAVRVPLLNGETRISMIEPSVVYDRHRISFTVRSVTGEEIPFSITRKPIQSATFSTFLACTSSILHGFVDSAKRDQSLMSCPSVEFKDGFWLTQTAAIPLSSLSDGTFRKLSVNWNTTFAYRYAAACALQYLVNGAAFADDDIWIDEKSCGIIIRHIRPRSGPCSFNLLRRYLDELLITGPFKAGLLSAFVCFAYAREKLGIFLDSLLDLPPSSVLSVEAVSIVDNINADVSGTVDNIITASLTHC